MTMTPGEAAERRLADLACRCILRLGHPRLPTDPLTMLRLSRGVFLYTVEEFREIAPEKAGILDDVREDVPALSFGDGDGRWTVVWRPELPGPRRRFSLAHELGHIALRHHPDPRRRPRREEGAANAFARFLVMPPPVVHRLLEEGLLAYLEQAALVFGVSLTTAEIALSRPQPLPEEPVARSVEALLLEDARRRRPRGTSLRWHAVPGTGRGHHPRAADPHTGASGQVITGRSG